jgi:hypothetical protein
MKLIKQIAVFVANRPGTLTKVIQTLADHNIDILGVMVADAVDHAVMRLGLDKPDDAIHLLGDAGLLVLDTEVFMLEVDNRPGILYELGQRLSEAGINIEYAYGGVNRDGNKGILFIKASDPSAAVDLMKV